MNIPGKRVGRTRLVRTDRFVIAVEVEAVIPDADPSEACFEPQVVELLREVESHASGMGKSMRRWKLRETDTGLRNHIDFG
jgi:hypothetical protein